jgi:hypothetical protein
MDKQQHQQAVNEMRQEFHAFLQKHYARGAFVVPASHRAPVLHRVMQGAGQAAASAGGFAVAGLAAALSFVGYRLLELAEAIWGGVIELVGDLFAAVSGLLKLVVAVIAILSCLVIGVGVASDVAKADTVAEAGTALGEGLMAAVGGLIGGVANAISNDTSKEDAGKGAS